MEEGEILIYIMALEGYSLAALLMKHFQPELKREWEEIVFMCTVCAMYWSQKLQDVRGNS